MIQSMTAFARAQKHLVTGHLCWEIRSVNHRYLDVSFRMPEVFRFIEPSLRAALRDVISRGKLECQLKFQDTNSDNQSMLINESMVKSLVDMSNSIADAHLLANDLSVSQVLSWPGVIQVGQSDMDETAQHALELFVTTIKALAHTRNTEGSALKAHVSVRLNALKLAIARAKQLTERLAGHTKDKLLSRLQAVQIEVSDSRIEQEIALILTRLDVNEELDRLHTHSEEVARTLDCDTIAGRRLDFLMQELNREANTISSKSDWTELTQIAVEMKVLIEQMREQIQNIE